MASFSKAEYPGKVRETAPLGSCTGQEPVIMKSQGRRAKILERYVLQYFDDLPDFF